MPVENTLTCSQISRQAGESLVATATPAGVYLVVEYNGPWGSQAVDESEIPVPVLRRLEGAAKAYGPAKVLVCKSRSGLVEPGVRLFAAVCSGPAPRLYQFLLASYPDILDLDLEAALAGTAAQDAHLRTDPLFFVCTNGRRDSCCALYGQALYRVLVSAAGEAAWQCSHLGGHRFAPNLLCLPSGLLYGRVDPAGLPSLVESLRRGRLELEGLRGRSAYPSPAQAAETFLRRQTRSLELDAFRLAGVEALGQDRWEVRFEPARDGPPYQVIVSRSLTGESVYESCHKDKLTPAVEYRLESIRS